MSDIWPGGGAEKDEMDSHGFPRLDPERAERLLSGRSAADAADMSDPLAQVLAAAAAPVRPGELAGEQAALAAFRSAVPVAAQRPAGPLSRWRRLLAFKVGALVVALTAGGVALAAGAGLVPGVPGLPGLPSPFDDERPSVAPSSVSSGPLPSATTSVGAATEPSAPAPSGEAGASPTPMSVAAVHGHCRAYLAAPRGDRGKALQRSELAELATLAGGEEEIEAYCVAVLAGQKPVKPAKSPHPTSQPSQAPNAVTEPATPEPVAS